MRYYFDFSFIESLPKLVKDEDIFDEFFRRFLKELFGNKIFILDPGEKEPAARENPIFRRLLDAGATLVSFPEIHEDIANNSDAPFKFFFLDNLSPLEITENYGYFALDSTSFENAWKVIQRYQEAVHRTLGEEITHWSELKDCDFPVNSIAFVDRYFFGNDKAIQNNLIPLLKSLNLKKLGKRKVDILFIGRDFIDDKQFKNSNFQRSFDLLCKHFDYVLGADGYNLSLIRVAKDTIPNEAKYHYRLLMTNNVVLLPGLGFDYFNSSPKSTEALTTRLFVRSKTYSSMSKYIIDFKSAFDKVHDKPYDTFSGCRRLTKNESTHALIKLPVL